MALEAHGVAAGQPPWLHIQDQPLGLAAAAADHDLLVGRLLFFAEYRVVMLGNAGDHPRLARAANAELTGIIDIDTGLEQHFENFLAFGDEIFLAGARQFDPEPAYMAGRAVVLRREIFDMNVSARAACRGGLERFEHRVRATAIKMRVLWRRFE